MTISEQTQTTIALAIGCPAGVAPELTAKMLADPDVVSAARIVVFGDSRVLAMGAEQAGVSLEIDRVEDVSSISKGTKPVLVDLKTLDPKAIELGTLSPEAGAFAVANFKAAIDFTCQGKAEVVAWTPFNKAAMRLAHPGYEDEIVFTAEMLDFRGAASEFNILPNLWNARVTSHVPLSKVADLITHDNVLENLRLTHKAMKESGLDNPRIALAGLNPHAGDGGNFGWEEIDVLAPVVAEAQAEGIACDGPFPSDTVFVRAKRGDFDAVLTMYHDQGQIAMKLIGFDLGVTLLGGFPMPLVTAAHGSAYDIAGKGIANPGAMRHAMLLAARMGHSRLKRMAA